MEYPKTLNVYAIKRGKVKVPFIRLCGRWIENVCGFEKGEVVSIERSKGRITIKKL